MAVFSYPFELEWISIFFAPQYLVDSSDGVARLVDAIVVATLCRLASRFRVLRFPSLVEAEWRGLLLGSPLTDQKVYTSDQFRASQGVAHIRVLGFFLSADARQTVRCSRMASPRTCAWRPEGRAVPYRT